MLGSRCKYHYVFATRARLTYSFRSINSHSSAPIWPSGTNPTPYEIFGTSPDKFDRHHVKNTYFKLIKLYHPDSSLRLEPEISLQERTMRFRKIKEAYEILKDDGKRRQYDFAFGTAVQAAYSSNSTRRYGEPGRGPYSHFRASYSRPGAFRSEFNPKDHLGAFYTGEPFGRFGDEFMNQRNDEEFEEQLRQNRVTLTWIVACTVFIVGAIELKALFSASDRAIQNAQHLSYLSKLDEIKARSNYGMGLFPEDRVARFLAVRDSAGYIDNYKTKGSMTTGKNSGTNPMHPARSLSTPVPDIHAGNPARSLLPSTVKMVSEKELPLETGAALPLHSIRPDSTREGERQSQIIVPPADRIILHKMDSKTSHGPVLLEPPVESPSHSATVRP